MNHSESEILRSRIFARNHLAQLHGVLTHSTFQACVDHVRFRSAAAGFSRHGSLGDGVEEDGVRWDVVRSDLCHALGEVIHNGALSRDLHAAKDGS